jgi:hypothetical protein
MDEEEEQIEEKGVFQKAKDLLKKNLAFIALGSVGLFLIIIVTAVSLAGKRAPTIPRPTVTSTLPPPPQFIEAPTPEAKASSLEEEVGSLKEELAKINLPDLNLSFPNLDFAITLKPK